MTDRDRVTTRVVHCGTGLTGREALRAIIEDPALELVGQYVSTPEKVGMDAGDLCGLPPTGVLRPAISTPSSPCVPTASVMPATRSVGSGKRARRWRDSCARGPTW